MRPPESKTASQNNALQAFFKDLFVLEFCFVFRCLLVFETGFYTEAGLKLGK